MKKLSLLFLLPIVSISNVFGQNYLSTTSTSPGNITITHPGSVSLTGTGSYLTLTSRYNGGSNGNILFQNGSNQNLILAETAPDNWTIGYGLTPGSVPNSVISWNASKNTTFAGTLTANSQLKMIDPTSPWLTGFGVNGDPTRFISADVVNSAVDTDPLELVYSRGAGVIIGNSGATNKYLQVNGPLTANGNINLAGASGRRIYMGGVGGTTFGMAYDAANPNYGIFYTEATPDYVSISPNGNANNGVMNVFGDGKVGIGTSSPGSYTLAVEGKIGAREVNVIATNPWPDYVFEKNYTLPTLESIKAYIDQNKHLPEVPSATEVEKNGVNLGEMNALLLKKIEELTLYVIEQNKRDQDQKKQIETLLMEVEKLKNKK